MTDRRNRGFNFLRFW